MGLVTSAIRIPFNQEVVDNLTFSNPFEPDKAFLAYFEQANSNIRIPRGYPISTEGFKEDVNDAYCMFKVADSYKLRDYQGHAIAEVLHHFQEKPFAQLLLSAPTGSGKSFAMAGLIANLQQRTLIISHLTMLGSQMCTEISKNLVEANIKILDIKSDLLTLPDIAICSFQLLNSNKALLLACANTYGLVIVDESENSFTTSRLQVLYSLKAKYHVYLTATPSRELTKQTAGLFYLFGDKAVSMTPPEEHVVHSKHLFMDYKPLSWQSPLDKNQYKVSQGRFILQSVLPRDISVLCKVLKDRGVQGTFWVIADLSKVQDRLEQLLVSLGLTVGIIRGTTSAKQRDKILEAINNDKLDVLIGSAPLSAGLSIPRLSVGIRLLPNSSSEELLVQMRGRLNRFTDFKATQSPLWIDFIIGGSLEYGAKKRYQLYKQTTHGVLIVKPAEAAQVILKEIL